MGNRGGPSTGCQTCRSRRIKCDEGKPTCKNCRRSKRACSGYRDEADLKFRNENEVAKRHALQLPNVYHQSYTPILRSFAVDSDDAVLNQFSQMSALADGSAEGHGGLLAVMRSLYANAHSSSPCVPAILAMAWATCAPFGTVTQRMSVARRKYGEAIGRLREALEYPHTAKKDDTLFAVLLMGFIENMTATSQSMPQPSKHINGAIMLINLRGRQNLASDAARKMFSFVKVSLTVDPVPHRMGNLSFNDEVIAADRSASEATEAPTAQGRLATTAFAIAILREQINRMDTDFRDPQAICELFRQSRNLDKRLVTWRSLIPEEWETFSLLGLDEQEQLLEDAGSASARTWLGRTASYPDLLIARMLNDFRMHRLAVQGLILRCAAWIRQECNAEDQSPKFPMTEHIAAACNPSTRFEAQRIIKTSVDEICASVPFHLENSATASEGAELSDLIADNVPGKLLKKTFSSNAFSPEQLSTERVQMHPARKAGCFMILQPLVLAYSVSGISSIQKEWMLGRALKIARGNGMDERMVEMRLTGLSSTQIQLDH